MGRGKMLSDVSSIVFNSVFIRGGALSAEPLRQSNEVVWLSSGCNEDIIPSWLAGMVNPRLFTLLTC